MASRPKKAAASGNSNSKAALASPSSSTTTTTTPTSASKRQTAETFVNEQSSPGSSSVKSSVAKKLYSGSGMMDVERSKENVTVTVRFRPLSARETRQGEETAWYADGDMVVRNEDNHSLAYAYDRVFGPTMTTRHVYDVAAQHVVCGAMEGINGTIFAYGVTSSGKTHTMHGDQRSPGIIPLAVKDIFSIIQETPSREFLLRLSYLEIYNEVVNDLLNPEGQNLRIREDFQGTFVEGIKEEVVLSPAHALSLIAAGEEHRHVGSNNFNLLSSRSHTIFTLTIESSPCGSHNEGETVNLSMLNLIDLAGSESSRAETTGVRRKEGAYINKSLLTLGTVISKLTDGKATHIPYRDSKLTRLLQSSLSGQGRISLICTLTPSSSSSEETHNTLKFAHRAKHVEIQASQNKIIDEKSLLKKYQNEIRCLKEELEQFKSSTTVSPVKGVASDDLARIKQKLEDGHVKLQSRLEQEEEAKAALLGRIQRLTKLILVSTKETQSRVSQPPATRRRHSFGEEELAYLPNRKQDMLLESENVDFLVPMEDGESTDCISKEEKKSRKHGLLNWFKLRKRDSGSADLTGTYGDKSSLGKSHIAPLTSEVGSMNCPTEPRISNSLDAENSPLEISDVSHSREVPNDDYSLQETSLASMRSTDHVDLLKERVKILSGEVALRSSILKRLSEEASISPKKDQIQMEMRKIADEMEVKNGEILSLEKQIADSATATQNRVETLELSPSYAEVLEQLNERSFELEVKAADNRIIQDQLQQKIHECEALQETISSLNEQLAHATESSNSALENIPGGVSIQNESCLNKENSISRDVKTELMLQEQALEIDELKQKLTELTEANDVLESQNQKLAEESSYAKELASAAGVELRALSEQVTNLMNQNERLAAEFAVSRNSNQRRTSTSGTRSNKRDCVKRQDQVIAKQEIVANRERELSLETALMEMEQREAELQGRLEETKQREADLENELASMWILVAKLKNSRGTEYDEADP